MIMRWRQTKLPKASANSPPISSSSRNWSRRRSADPRQQKLFQLIDLDPLLLHRIAFAQGHRVAQRRVFFAERFEVDGNAERRACFVLPPIATADRAGLVVENVHVRSERRDDLASLGDEL